MMSDVYRPLARVTPPGGDYTDPLAQIYKVYLFRKTPDGRTLVIYDDGPRSVEYGEGAEYPRPSLVFTPEFAVPLYEALGEALGKNAPTDTTVLREWLECERKRVDDVLQWADVDEV